jgi:hypothetical protein
VRFGNLGLSAYAEKLVHFTACRKGKMPCDEIFTNWPLTGTYSQSGIPLSGAFDHREHRGRG